MRRCNEIASQAAKADRSRRSQAGFTLVEALVAFTILALMTVILQRGLVGSVDAAARSNERLEAVLVARTLLVSPTVTDSGQAVSGRMNGHDWRVRFEDLPFASGSPGRTGRSVFRPMRIIVDVETSRRGSGLLTVQSIAMVRTSGEEAR